MGDSSTSRRTVVVYIPADHIVGFQEQVFHRNLYGIDMYFLIREIPVPPRRGPLRSVLSFTAFQTGAKRKRTDTISRLQEIMEE